MSNLSDIGFPVQGEHDVNEILMSALGNTTETKCERGVYLNFSDASGAELYLQGNREQELIGFNPHFAGKSIRTVSLTDSIERDSSELDGGFRAWANPAENGLQGEYQFIFDVPDFRTVEEAAFPKHCDIQLTAFGSNDFQLADGEDADSEQSEPAIQVRSFVASGLDALKEMDETDLTLARPIASFAGEITEFERKKNSVTNEEFYWFLVETLGGEVDVVIDPKFVTIEPKIGGTVSGTFWLSGRVLS